MLKIAQANENVRAPAPAYLKYSMDEVMDTRNSDFRNGRKTCVHWSNSGRFLFLFGMDFLVLQVEMEKKEIIS